VVADKRYVVRRRAAAAAGGTKPILPARRTDVKYREGARAAAATVVATTIRLAAALGTTELRSVGAPTPFIITKRIANLSEAALIPSGRLHARRGASAAISCRCARNCDTSPRITTRAVESFADC